MGLDARIYIGEGADRSRNLTSRDLGPSGDQAGARAGELGVGLGELKPEGGRLGVDAVAAPDAKRVLVLPGAPFERFQHRAEIGEE